eukprot:684320-Rhodomonas_salina.1
MATREDTFRTRTTRTLRTTSDALHRRRSSGGQQRRRLSGRRRSLARMPTASTTAGRTLRRCHWETGANMPGRRDGEGVRVRGGGQELASREFGWRGMSDYSPEGWKGLKTGQYANCELN